MKVRELHIEVERSKQMSGQFPEDDQFQVEDHAHELKQRDQWVCWQYREKEGKDKPNKVPVNPSIVEGSGLRWKNSESWLSYEEALAYFQADNRIDGIGFVTHEGDPYCFLDLDEYPDEETGEISEWIFQLAELASTYTYFTPNFGLRIVGKGTLKKEGECYWTDPSTRKVHKLEAYHHWRMLAFTDRVGQDIPIVDIQPILDTLTKHSMGGSFYKSDQEIPQLDEAELPDDLEQIRAQTKRILVRNGVSPAPVVQGSRKISLISALAKIYHAGASREYLWKIANQINDTLFYTVSGDLGGLPDYEVLDAYKSVLKLKRQQASPETLNKLGELLDFLVGINPYVKRNKDSAWKLLIGLIEQGAKYGSISEGGVVVECSWLTLMEKSRIGSQQTLDKWLKDLNNSRIINYVSFHKNKLLNAESSLESSYYKINADLKHMGSYFDIDDLVVQNLIDCRKVNTPYHPFSTTNYVYWRNGIGNATLKLILALEHLQGEANTGDIALAMGRVNNRGKGNSGAISTLVKKLGGWGLIEKVSHGRYKLVDDYELKLFEVCDAVGEFDRSEKYKVHKKRLREAYKRYKQLRKKYRSTQRNREEGTSVSVFDLDEVTSVAA